MSDSTLTKATKKHEIYHLRWRRERVAREVTNRLSGPQAAARVASEILSGEFCEVLLTFYLDTQHRIIGYSEVGRGTINSSLISPHMVFTPALREGATAVIVVHNHPSGDPTLSPEDRAVAENLTKAGEIVGIALLDFLAVGDEGRWASTNGSP